MSKGDSIINKAFMRHLDVAKESCSVVVADVEKAADLIFGSINAGHKLLVCGNGGSAADSEHFAAEFLCRYKDHRRPFPAIALNTHTSTMTAIGNDYSFEEIFSRQTEALGQKGDVLAVFTTSGKSKNILAAVEAAKKKGLKTIIFTGEMGAGLGPQADVVVVAPSVETARIQEIHGICIHSICEYMDAKYGVMRA